MKFIDDIKHIDSLEDALWTLPDFESGTQPQQNLAADNRRKAVVHFWNEKLTMSQRTQENYDILLAAVSRQLNPIWWIENKFGNFAYLFQEDMPKLSLPRSGNPDWYKE